MNRKTLVERQKVKTEVLAVLPFITRLAIGVISARLFLPPVDAQTANVIPGQRSCGAHRPVRDS